MQIRPRRSVLYMPGSNARALEKAKSLPADALILDLEDAVAPDAKAAARDQVCAAVKDGGYGHRELVIRINALDTPWGEADLSAAASAAPDAVLIPKPGSAADMLRAVEALSRAGAPDKTRLWAMVETPIAILNLREIASAIAAARLPGHGHQRPRQGDARRPLRQPPPGALLALRHHHGGARLRSRCARRRLQQLQGCGRLPQRMRARPPARLRRQDPHSSRSGRDRQRGVRAAGSGRCLGQEDHRRLREAREQGQGRDHRRGRMVELLHAEMARRTVAIAEAIGRAGAA